MKEMCQYCKKEPAEVKCTILINDQRMEINLCLDCARIAGMQEQIRLNRKVGRKDKPEFVAKTEVFCNKCKLSFLDFVKTGVLGCPGCYDVFDDKLVNILKGIHSSSFHRGRAPGKEKEVDIAQLKWRLSEAIQSEDFELAARLRDKIEQLEKDMN